MPELELTFDRTHRPVLDDLLANDSEKATRFEDAVCGAMVDLGVLNPAARTDPSYLAFTYLVAERLAMGDDGNGRRAPGIMCKVNFSAPSKYVTEEMMGKLGDVGKAIREAAIAYLSQHCPRGGVDYSSIFAVWPIPLNKAVWVDGT
jgi:hypothetical protein